MQPLVVRRSLTELPKLWIQVNSRSNLHNFTWKWHKILIKQFFRKNLLHIFPSNFCELGYTQSRHRLSFAIPSAEKIAQKPLKISTFDPANNETFNVRNWAANVNQIEPFADKIRVTRNQLSCSRLIIHSRPWANQSVAARSDEENIDVSRAGLIKNHAHQFLQNHLRCMKLLSNVKVGCEIKSVCAWWEIKAKCVG